MSVSTGAGRYSGARTRKNAGVFLVGKVLSALATLALLAVVVRALSLSDYAAYVSLVALMETGVVLGTLGVEWMVLRNAHEFVVHERGDLLGQFVRMAALMRLASCAALGVAGFVVLPLVVRHWAEMDRWLLALVAAWLAVEGVLRLLRDNTLESLAAQTQTQIGAIARSALALAMVVASWRSAGSVSLRTMLVIDLSASALTLLYVLWAVHGTVRQVPRGGSTADWTAPTFRSMWPLALSNYFSGLLSSPFSTQTLTLLVSMFAPAPAVAGFGFVARLTEIVRGYLPALMLMSVLRPRLFGIYAMTRDFAKVAFEAGLAHRLSALMVVPLAVLVALHGQTLLSLVSAQRFGAAQGWLLAAFVLTLVPRVMRQVMVALVNCVQQAPLLMRPSIVAILGYVPLAALAWWSGRPEVLVLAVAWDECIWVALLVSGMNRAGFALSIDPPFLLKIFTAGAVPLLVFGLLGPAHSLPLEALAAVGAMVLFAGLAVVLKPLNEAEVGLLSRAVRRH